MAASECERTCRNFPAARRRGITVWEALSHEWAVSNAPGTEYRCADARRRDPACKRVSTQCRRAVSCADDIRAIWKGRAAAGVHAGGLGPTEQDLSGDFGGFVLQARRVRTARPRGVGPGRLYSYQRRLPWSGQVVRST